MNCEALKEFASSMNKKGHMVKKNPRWPSLTLAVKHVIFGFQTA